MAYYIPNPALQGFQEGNALIRQERGIFGGMMENYMNNAAAYGRQLAQQAEALQRENALAKQGLTATGEVIPSGTEKRLAEALKGRLAEYEKLFAPNAAGQPALQDFFRIGWMQPVTAPTLLTAVPTPK